MTATQALEAPVQETPAGSPSAPPRRPRLRRPPRPRPARTGPDLRPVAEWTVIPTRVLLTCAVLAGWVLLYVLVISRVQEQHSQQGLYDTFRQRLAAQTAPVGGRIAVGAPVALIDIPEVGVHRIVVVEGTAAGVMRSGPGHLRNTPLPGQAGVSVIFGRAVMFGAPFSGIAQLQPGDRYTVTTGQGVFTYVVSGVREDGDPVPLPLAAGGARLTLITATGQGGQSGLAPNKALYVDSELSGKPQPTPAGRPGAVDAAESQLAVDKSEHVFIQLILCLQLAIVLAVGFAWGWNRWDRRKLWLGGVPVFVAVLWGLSSTASQLLPNLL